MDTIHFREMCVTQKDLCVSSLYFQAPAKQASTTYTASCFFVLLKGTYRLFFRIVLL